VVARHRSAKPQLLRTCILSSLRVVNGTVLTMTSDCAPIAGGVVCMAQGLITYAGPADQAPEAAGEQVIDAAGCVVLPGLVNAHTHSAMTLFRGYADDMPLQTWLEDWIWPAEARLTPEDVYWGSIWLVEPFTVVTWNYRPPDQALSLVYLCGTSWNETYMCIPEMDDLIIRARGETTLAERQATYAEVQELLIDDASRIIPAFRGVFLGLLDNVRGVSAHPNNWLYLTEAWLTD